MPHVVILKIGGSVLTEKHKSRPILRERLIQHIASTLARVWRSPHAPRIILLYGGGSFGHPLAHRYRLMDSPLNLRTLRGFGYTTTAMRYLGNRLADIFLAAGLPVIPLQTSAFIRQRRGRLHFTDFTTIDAIVGHGGIPLLGGDVVIADQERTVIASADTLLVRLAAHFRNAELLFAADVEGVYDVFPPPQGVRPHSHLSRKDLATIVKGSTLISRRDVTGGMIGKLKTLLQLKNARVVIFNGRTSKNFGIAFAGKNIGTVIHL